MPRKPEEGATTVPAEIEKLLVEVAEPWYVHPPPEPENVVEAKFAVPAVEVANIFLPVVFYSFCTRGNGRYYCIRHLCLRPHEALQKFGRSFQKSRKGLSPRIKLQWQIKRDSCKNQFAGKFAGVGIAVSRQFERTASWSGLSGKFAKAASEWDENNVCSQNYRAAKKFTDTWFESK